MTGWIGVERVVTVESQWLNPSSAGSEKVASILDCHRATGRIGRPGPFPVIGRPNTMGGRATMLAVHLSPGRSGASGRGAGPLTVPGPRRRPRPEGGRDVPRLRRRADHRALDHVHNPADSLPEADAPRDAIAACAFMGRTGTAPLAHVLLRAIGT